MKRKAIDVGALERAAQPPADPVRAATAKKTKQTAKAEATSRADKVQIQGYFEPELRARLKVLSAQSGKTVETLLREAIESLLTAHKVPKTVRTS